jgi:2-succinyl-6-hydroxy-2,4-cyclohexadiene-1-carboxylate synthase
MEACAAQVEGVLEALDVRQPHLLGYSMGGRVALALATAHPERFASVVLIGAHAGIADPTARHQRVADDEALADRIEREGVPAFVDYWTDLPLFAGQKRLDAECQARHREQRLDNRARGLANSLRGMGAGAQPRLQPALPALQCPVLLAVGERDVKFRALAEDLAARLPDARIAVVPGVGHAAHVEDPAGFLRIARRFLASIDAVASADGEAAAGRSDAAPAS